MVREEQPHEGTHPTGTWASSSAATDGRTVLAFFGSRGLYALDMDGKLLWEKDLGDMKVKLGFGEGSTPALAKDQVFVQWDHDGGDSFLVALDRRTGKELWRQKREEETSWASPLVIERAGRTQVVTSATKKIRSYDAQSGEVIWETPGMTMNAIPTPVQAGGLVFLTSGFRGNALLAVKLDEAKGDISASPAIAWKLDRDTPYVPSPLLYGDELYILKGNNGLLTCLDAKTGERLYGPERLEGVPNVYASPIGAGGRVYIPGRDGATAVVERGRAFKLLATNTLEDGFDASPVAVARSSTCAARSSCTGSRSSQGYFMKPLCPAPSAESTGLERRASGTTIRAVLRPRAFALAFAPLVLHALARELDRALGLVLRAEVEPAGLLSELARALAAEGPAAAGRIAFGLAAGVALVSALAWLRTRAGQERFATAFGQEAPILAPLLLRPALTLLALASVTLQPAYPYSSRCRWRSPRTGGWPRTSWLWPRSWHCACRPRVSRRRARARCSCSPSSRTPRSCRTRPGTGTRTPATSRRRCARPWRSATG